MKRMNERESDTLYHSNVVKVMLDELVLRQEKLTRMERARIYWALFVLACLAALLFFSYDLLTWRQSTITGNLLNVATSEPLLLILVALIIIGMMQVRLFVKKSTKAEDEFESLRKEVIERNSELWEGDHLWQQREAIYSYMKKNYGINLYHN